MTPILWVDHMGKPGLPDLALVRPVDPAQFEADIELIASQIGKKPTTSPEQWGVWLAQKYRLIRHLPAERWQEMVPVAFNSWRFWNEFTSDWVEQCARDLARLAEEERTQDPPIEPISPCPAWLSLWLPQCAEARALDRPQPTPQQVQEQMRAQGLDPLEPRQNLNQLILRSLGGESSQDAQPESHPEIQPEIQPESHPDAHQA